MRVRVERKGIKFLPDSSRVVARFFNNGESRTRNLIARVMVMSQNELNQELEHTLRDFSGCHRNITRIFFRHFENIRGTLEAMEIDHKELSEKRKMLIGSYCTMEYSIESAAFFNPSIIEDFSQSFVAEGERRVLLSFRATGEGHLSSIVFRRGILDKNNDLHIMKIRNHIDAATIG